MPPLAKFLNTDPAGNRFNVAPRSVMTAIMPHDCARA
jgi:hypothetical protein